MLRMYSDFFNRERKHSCDEKITIVLLERNKHHSKVKTISFGNVIRTYLPFVYVCVCVCMRLYLFLCTYFLQYETLSAAQNILSFFLLLIL